MKIDKHHPTWKKAPLHIKACTVGIKTYTGLKRAGIFSFILAVVGYVVVMSAFGKGRFMLAVELFFLTAFGLSAYLCAVVQIWLLQNSEVLVDDA